MIETLDAIRPDVVCVSGWDQPGSLATLQWAARNSVPAVMLSESSEFDEPRFAVREYIKRQVVGVCSAGLAGGTPQAEYLAKLGLPRESIFLGYDAVDNNYFRRNAERLKTETLRAESRNRYGLPERYFLASARFTEKKNLPRLLEAYAMYRGNAEMLKAEMLQGESGEQKAQSWDLVLLGDGPLRPALNSQLSTLNLHGHFHLPGARPYSALPAYYGLASVFVHASTTEQWGLVVNEAMASGLPVLVSKRCGCAPDLVREGVNGFTFDPLDVEQLAQLMLKLSTLNSQLSTMGAASRRIISEWGPDRFAAGLKAAVERALNARHRQASLLSRSLLKALLLR
jgi:glycosyltransferase involved in cell wall biosynthesis